MNYLQIIAFLIYALSVLIVGITFYNILIHGVNDKLSRALWIGESYLLGSIVVIGGLVLFSIGHLYQPLIIWGFIGSLYLLLLIPSTQHSVVKCFQQFKHYSIPKMLFFLLLIVFVFRNSFFLIDIDSHSTYLYAQKLWLNSGTSIIGNEALDVRVFVPHFNAVPYALGIALFGQSTLFAQLIVISWTILAAVLIYSYTSYRFNGWYGVAAVMLILFNDHMFYSGVNKCCVINSALICLLFTSGYNFWEANKEKNILRFVLAIIFLSQLMANKYQVAYVMIGFLLLGCFIQEFLNVFLKALWIKKRYRFALLIAIGCTATWYVKNFLITGVPTFPFLAGKLHVWNWNSELTTVFNKVYVGGLTASQIFKFLTYFFIWPGINAAKIVVLFILLFPLLLITLLYQKQIDKKQLAEMGYWMTLSILFVVGICFVSFVDPRHYRYGIAVFSFTSILMLDFLFKNCLHIKVEWIVRFIILVIALQGYKVIGLQGGGLLRPTFQDNIGVLTNRIHFQDIVYRYYPDYENIQETLQSHPGYLEHSAWDTGVAGTGGLSFFLLPIRPQIGLWHTTIVRWESYNQEDMISQDLRNFGIEKVLRMKNDQLTALTPEEYAEEAVNYERYPKRKFFNYGFPEELSKAEYVIENPCCVSGSE